MRLIILFLALFITLDAFTQHPNNSRLILIDKLSHYRGTLLNRAIDDGVPIPIETIVHISSTASNKEIPKGMMFDLRYSFDVSGGWNEAYYEKIKKRGLYKQILESIEWYELLQLMHHEELAELVFEDVLSPHFPFPILVGKQLFQELDFYEIKTDEYIAEIGAGSGAFSMLLAMMTCERLYINELNEWALEYIDWKFRYMDSTLITTPIEIIQGYKKQTNLPERQLDKILIRNSFHHFQRKKDMLESIKNAFREEGMLYIMEYKKGGENVCHKMLDEWEVDDIVQKNGFRCTGRLSLEDRFVLQYVPAID